MKFRANTIGGELNIQRGASGGTVVSCRVSRGRCEGRAN
jgi:signal transduction histidine kinase